MCWKKQSSTLHLKLTNIQHCEHLSAADESGNRILPLGDRVLFLEGIQHVISIGF